jgi:hypothetical protein
VKGKHGAQSSPGPGTPGSSVLVEARPGLEELRPPPDPWADGPWCSGSSSGPPRSRDPTARAPPPAGSPRP